MLDKVLFEETQQFRYWYIYVIHVFMICISLFIAVGINTGEIEFSKIFIPIFFLLMVVFLWVQKLKMMITDKYLEYSFFPLVGKRRVEWKDIQSAQMVTYGLFVAHGIRFTFTRGTICNVSGRKAIQIQTKAGKKFAIGTQKPEELDEVLTYIFKQTKSR